MGSTSHTSDTVTQAAKTPTTSDTTPKTEPVWAIHSSRDTGRPNNSNSRRGRSDPPRLKERRSDGLTNEPCSNCGGPFRPRHVPNCPARAVTCRACGKRDHLARVCRSSNQAPANDAPPVRSSSATPAPPYRNSDRRGPSRQSTQSRQPLRYIGQSAAEHLLERRSSLSSWRH